jgi:hypothetical protein
MIIKSIFSGLSPCCVKCLCNPARTFFWKTWCEGIDGLHVKGGGGANLCLFCYFYVLVHISLVFGAV